MHACIHTHAHPPTHTFCLGRYVELLGRKPSLALIAALNAAGFGAIAVSDSYSILVVGRLLTGLGAGLASVVAPCYIAEISPPAMRGSLGSLYQLLCTLGILASYGIGALVSWRELAAVTSLVSMVALTACQMSLPETPAWLAAKGRRQEAAVWQARLGVDASDPASPRRRRSQDKSVQED